MVEKGTEATKIDTLVADFGSSFVKVYGEGIRSIYPTVEMRFANRRRLIDIDVLEVWDDEKKSYEPFVVGEDAVAQGAFETLAGKKPRANAIELHGSAVQMIHLCYIFEETGWVDRPGKKHLVLTLPFGEYDKEDLVNKLKAMNHYRWKGYKGQERNLSIQRVSVGTQGTGAIFKMNVQPFGDATYESFGSVNLGGTTTDVPIWVWNQKHQKHVFHHKSFSDYEFTMGFFFSAYASGLAKLNFEHDILNYHTFSRCIMRDTPDFSFGGLISDKGIVEQAKALYHDEVDRYTSHLVKLLEDRLGRPLLRSMRLLPVTGGGALNINQGKFRNDSQVKSCSFDGVWADVEGLYAFYSQQEQNT